MPVVKDIQSVYVDWLSGLSRSLVVVIGEMS